MSPGAATCRPSSTELAQLSATNNVSLTFFLRFDNPVANSSHAKKISRRSLHLDETSLREAHDRKFRNQGISLDHPGTNERARSRRLQILNDSRFDVSETTRDVKTPDEPSSERNHVANCHVDRLTNGEYGRVTPGGCGQLKRSNLNVVLSVPKPYVHVPGQ